MKIQLSFDAEGFQGSDWARAFCSITGLPEHLSERRPNVLPVDEEVASVEPLPPLHDFQREVYKKFRKLLSSEGKSGLLSLPTGAGKTRVAVEAVLDHLAQVIGSLRNVVLWIAQSEELLRQAWTCFRQVWQTPPLRLGNKIPRPGVLAIKRAWGGHNPEGMALGPERTVVLASIQQLKSWVNRNIRLDELWPLKRLAGIIVDEAHRIIAPQHRDVLVALQVKRKHSWAPLASARPLIGLTATPWRPSDRGDEALRKLFQKRLLTPKSLAKKPIPTLQRRKMLARVISERLNIKGSPEMTPAQRKRYEGFLELPNDYLKILGRDPARNGRIIRRLLKVPKRQSALVFACSVEHAEVLTLALNLAGRNAAVVSGDTPRNERLETIAAFRDRRIHFLCNVGVFTAGFDAPKVDVVCLTRPTTSPLLYEQMVGRGLRGPKNGGKTHCRVLDVQDEGLPTEIMSYQRVLEEWGT